MTREGRECLDPFDEGLREAIGQINLALEGCTYIGGDEIMTHLKTVAKKGGCSLLSLCHNIR